MLFRINKCCCVRRLLHSPFVAKAQKGAQQTKLIILKELLGAYTQQVQVLGRIDRLSTWGRHQLSVGIDQRGLVSLAKGRL